VIQHPIHDVRVMLASCTLNCKHNLAIVYRKHLVVINDAQSETPATRSDKEECEHEPHSKELGRVGLSGENGRSESIGVGRDDRKEGTATSLTGGAVIGGMLGLLIAKTRAQLEESESHTLKLREYLGNLEEIFLELKRDKSLTDIE